MGFCHRSNLICSLSSRLRGSCGIPDRTRGILVLLSSSRALPTLDLRLLRTRTRGPSSHQRARKRLKVSFTPRLIGPARNLRLAASLKHALLATQQRSRRCDFILTEFTDWAPRLNLY